MHLEMFQLFTKFNKLIIYLFTFYYTKLFLYDEELSCNYATLLIATSDPEAETSASSAKKYGQLKAQR